MRRKKHFGQHFLSSFAILSREIKFINPRNKVILEIGPGDGRLSVRLAKFAKKLYVVERDDDLIPLLKTTFNNKGFDNVDIIHSDFLKIEPFSVDIVVGNIPYNLSSAITFRLLDWTFNEAYIMYQKEFAEKLMAKGKDRSRISFFAQYYFDIEPLMVVRRKYFSPPPKVDSMLVKLVPKDVSKLDSEIESIITHFFQNKKKVLRFTIRRILGYVPDELQPLANKRLLDISNEEILNLADYVKMYKY